MKNFIYKYHPFLMAAAIVIAFLVLIAWENGAWAGQKHTAVAGGTSSAQSSSSAQATAHGGASAAYGGNAQGIGFGEGGHGGAAHASNSASTGDSRIIVAPGLAGLTGTTCMGSTTASVGFAGFGGGVGTTWEDEQCTRRENIKLVAQFDKLVAERMILRLTGVEEAYREVYPTRGAASLPLMAHNKPDWCEGRDLRTASSFDKENCQ